MHADATRRHTARQQRAQRSFGRGKPAREPSASMNTKVNTKEIDVLSLAMDSGEPAVKRRRRVWLCNGGRAQSVFLEEGDIGDDVRRKAEPNMDDKQLSYVRLVTKDGTDIDLFEAVPGQAPKPKKRKRTAMLAKTKLPTARRKAKKAQKTTEADQTAKGGTTLTGADLAEPLRTAGERKLSFVVKTCLPDLAEFQMDVPADTRMADFRAMLSQKLCSVATFHSLELFTDRHPLPELDEASESKSLLGLFGTDPKDGSFELFVQPLAVEGTMPQNPQTEAGSFYAAFEACPAWQPFQCKQSDAGMSCYLSTLSMFKRLVSNELLRRRTLGHFRAVPDLDPDKVFEHSRLLFSMLLNHAADSDGSKEQWRVIDLKSLDGEMEVDWLQRVEEQTSEEGSGVPLMGRAWFLKRAPWLQAAWADCGEVAFWCLNSNGSGLGLLLVMVAHPNLPPFCSPGPIFRSSCRYPLATLQSECGRGEASFWQLIAAQVLGVTVHPCLTQGADGKVVVCSGMPPCSAGDVLLFQPCSGQEVSKCPHQLAREVRQHRERTGGTAEDTVSLATRAATEAVVICLDTSKSMSGKTGFDEDSAESESSDEVMEGWDATGPEDDSPAALDQALRLWTSNPSFLLFQRFLESGSPALRAVNAGLLLEETLRVERMKHRSENANFVRLATKHKGRFIDALLSSLQPQTLSEHPDESVPPAFRCAITQEIMADPVVAVDGFSYDRDAILQWFRLSGPPRSPMTGSILASAELTSNQNLKTQIAEWREAAARSRPGSFQIFYRGDVRGATEAWPGMLVETLRRHLADRLQAPTPVVVMKHQGRRLLDGQRLVEDCGVVRDDTVSVSVEFCGGVDNSEGSSPGMPLVVTVVWGRGPIQSEFRIAGGMNMSCQTLLFRLWVMSLQRGRPGRRPSESTLWFGLKDVGDGHREGHPLEFTRRIGDFAEQQALGGRYSNTVKLDWCRLYKHKKDRPDELTRLSCVKQLLDSFLNRVQAFGLPVDVGLLVFSSDVSLTCDPTAFSEDFRDQVQRARASGDTALYDAVEKAADALEAWQSKQDAEAANSKPALRIYVLSDGADTKSSTPCWRVAKRLQKAGIVLDAVHVGSCEMDDQLHALAKCTGGYVFRPKSIQEALRLHELEVVLHGPDRAPPTARPMVQGPGDLRKFGPRSYPVDRSDDGALPARRQPQQLTRRAISLETAIRQSEGQNGPEVPNPGPAPNSSGSPEAQLPVRRADRQRRLLREMRALMTQAHPNFDVYPCDEDLGFWRLVLAMDQEADLFTPYATGTWLLYVLFPPDYPERPPEVRFVTSIKHCNVNAYGRICHSILDRNYTTDTPMTEILRSVYGLILSPEKEDAIDVALALQCHNDPDGYRRAIAQHVQ
ncbi:unnamed protein product, partial [Symbiodinium microadriaticum]